jgi:hypothetical protein
MLFIVPPLQNQFPANKTFLRQRTSHVRNKKTMKRISLEQLEQKIADPTVPIDELLPYLTEDRTHKRPFYPAFRPNPSVVDFPEGDFPWGQWAADWSNRFCRLRRKNAFYAASDDDPRPVLVSEGDSWFQFPFFLNDVIDQLEPNYRRWSADAAGDTLQNMVVDNPEYPQALAKQRDCFKAFLFSGAGNDIVGAEKDNTSVLERIVLPFEPDREAAWFIENDNFKEQLAFIESAYRKVLDHVKECYPDKPVLLHGYDYALPGGYPGDPRQPSYADQDQWIARYFNGSTLHYPEYGLPTAIVRCMIDRLNEMQIRLCGGNHPGGAYTNVYHIDVRGLMPKATDWNDELHPTDLNFRKVAERFRRVLQEVVR